MGLPSFISLALASLLYGVGLLASMTLFIAREVVVFTWLRVKCQAKGLTKRAQGVIIVGTRSPN